MLVSPFFWRLLPVVVVDGKVPLGCPHGRGHSISCLSVALALKSAAMLHLLLLLFTLAADAWVMSSRKCVTHLCRSVKGDCGHIAYNVADTA